ncbi:MAG: glycoside hydrolase family 2 TIM barrel-domain containing protein [Prevotella sp.]|jgi:beta-galactosidase
MKKRTSILLFLLGCLNIAYGQQRYSLPLSHWQFSRDSLHWQQVTVPHDWAISGPFDKKWDLQWVAITQNGEKEKTEKSGRSGALPWIGRGFYTTTVEIDRLPGQSVLCFDGAMAEPEVYVNGHHAGGWKYGYSAFRVNITPYLQKGSNRISVSLNNREESSRWYPGAGLYRPVELLMVPSVYLDSWATYVRTLSADNKQAKVSVQTELQGLDRQKKSNDTKDYRLEFSLISPDGTTVNTSKAVIDETGKASVLFSVDNPKLWSPETPYIYRLRTRLYRKNRLIDENTIKTGIRTVKVDATRGFQLNGVSRKIQGVCLHHDLGPLGAAVNKAALIRQIRLMKEMGADAIRTSHNMPSQWQMEICDSMGMMVMAESFDMWRYPKCKNGYARFFDEWSDRDIANLVLANRNHPSIVMWSIGNEIPEQWSEEGRQISAHLQSLCHQYDPSRPVTQGMDRAEDALKSGFAQVMDVPGFNYRVYKYDRNMKQLPQGFLLGSETASTVSSRGVYKFPLVYQVAKADSDGQCNSYDNEWCSWSNLPEEDFMAQEDKPYTIGQFVWTGFDYLGEPTPYDEYWPSRSSYFGICDLAGLPKDRYYLYRSVWNKQEHTLHVLPHWTWPGREGEVTPVMVYTDSPEAELFVNGRSMGRKRKLTDIKVDDQHPATGEVAEERARRYRLVWDNVKYEPGEIRVVAYDNQGNIVQETSQRTAGEAAAVNLEPDRTTLKADGNDLSFITVSLVDAKGTLLPAADNEMEVSVSGAGHFRGICNGDATSLEVFTEPRMRLFSGKLVVVVQADNQPGEIHVSINDTQSGLKKEIVIHTIK